MRGTMLCGKEGARQAAWRVAARCGGGGPCGRSWEGHVLAKKRGHRTRDFLISLAGMPSFLEIFLDSSMSSQGVG